MWMGAQFLHSTWQHSILTFHGPPFTGGLYHYTLCGFIPLLLMNRECCLCQSVCLHDFKKKLVKAQLSQMGWKYPFMNQDLICKCKRINLEQIPSEFGLVF